MMKMMTPITIPAMAPGESPDGDDPCFGVGQVYEHEFPEHVNVTGNPGSCAMSDALFAVIK